MKFGESQGGGLIGQSVRRVEDARFVTGRGCYTDDIQLEGMAFGVSVRSPYPHAEIRTIDTTAARAADGVLAVYTAADIADYGMLPAIQLPGSVATPRPVLASGRVRYVGEPVAFVVAQTRAQAIAAAELVDVDYLPLAAVGSMEAALADGAAQIWPEAPGNIVFDWHLGDKAAVEAAFAKAYHIARVRVTQPRVAPTSMEVRAAIGAYDPAEGFTLHAGSQGSAALRNNVATVVLKVPVEQVRIVTPDVGGGFGMKWFVYPEYIMVLHAARALGRPVKWTGERTDAFLTDAMGRDLTSEAALAVDADGRFLALDVLTHSNLGAYIHQFGAMIQTMAGGPMMGGLYHIPAIHNHVLGVVTTTMPTDAYRGAGRPESCLITERAVEAAARALGLAPEEIRRRNLLRPDQLPHKSPLGVTFDVGDYPALLEKALVASDWAGFPARKQAAAARRQRLGRGMAYYVEYAASGGTEEFADIRMLDDGTIEVAVGTQSNGQGHETAFAQVVAERLGVPMAQVRIVYGDTSRLEVGNGTGGSRSMQWGGNACLEACAQLIDKGTALAAEALDSADIDYAEGLFLARGTNRSISLADLARRFPKALDVRGHAKVPAPTPVFPNGCHVVEVAIDMDTGVPTIARYTVVDDFGTVINPMLVEGQVHGGVAQGLGQVLMEAMIYDDSAQLLTGSFMDYALPRAAMMPEITFDTAPVPNPNNPLGVKGCGEAGSIGALAACVNALADALDGAPVSLPATPESLWRALQMQAA